ncbi:hypothetical protein [Ruegeria faecimaris]|uniref:Uncharacterized protein n=1 Tax=Ruegeria faecimaris TaxID=686389 RepID=A0A521EBU1_9RHOB|nr:hypothetical protein [Ruegeria faecimaris]SMO81404.1 hypothetical protein SAMN06265380_11091 [Ruegeria faecimaris]
MVLEYDFDIVTIASGENDPEATSSGAQNGRKVRALFRNVKTADALRAASPKIRKIFHDAGFGLDSTRSEITHGYYRPQDTADRDRILRALFHNIRTTGVKGEYCGEFDFLKFMNDVKAAKPRAGLPKEVPMWKPRPQQAESAGPNRRTVPGRVGFALGLAVIIFALLKYLAAAGATP